MPYRLSGPLRHVLAALLISATALPGAAGSDPAPGQRIEVRFKDLPGPYAQPSASNPAQRVAIPDGIPLRVPPGFEVTLFARGLRHPRNLLTLPDGTVVVAEQGPGVITRLDDGDGDGRAEGIAEIADGFDEPYGLAWHRDALMVADLSGVWADVWTGAAPRVRRLITEPGALGGRSGHTTRNLIFTPDGTRFLVAIGSASNLREEESPRATIQEFDADGRARGTLAAGLRNPVGLAFRPGTDTLYTVVNERDGLGDRLVPDYLTAVRRDGFYGWPYAYLGANPQPGFGGLRPDLVARTIVPDLLFEAHSAPLGLVFYTGTQFPERYRGNAFVALHGSWNRSDPVGYTVVHVPFRADRPDGGYETFVTGFRLAETAAGARARVWGRPAALAVAADGSLLIADDAGGTIWRVAWRAPGPP